MTVLRSRKIFSTVTTKTSQPLVPENVIVEPVTPSKAFELLDQSSNCTSPNSSSPAQNHGILELGLGSNGIMLSETGTVRRRSARLAKKLGISDCLENVEFGSGKWKTVEWSSLNGQLDARNLERRVLDLKSGGVPDVSVMGPQDLGNGNVMVTDTEEFNDGKGVVKLESSYDMETLKVDVVNYGRESGHDMETRKVDTVTDGWELCYDMETRKVDTVNDGRRKRKFSMKAKLLDSETHEQEELKSGFFSLRSGKKVVKREMGGDNGSAGNSLEGIENSIESDIVLSSPVPMENMSEASMEENGNVVMSSPVPMENMSEAGMEEYGSIVMSSPVPMETMSEARMEECDNSCRNVRRFSEGGKGKGKGKGRVGSAMSGSVCVNYELGDEVGRSLGDSDHNAISLQKNADSKEVVQDKAGIIIETDVKTRGRMSKEEKGKMKLGVKYSSSNEISTAELEIQNINDSSLSGTLHTAASGSLPDAVQVRETANDAGRVHRERFRNFARQNASRFAHFLPQQELGNAAPDVAGIEVPLPGADSRLEDWPGPFSTAIKIINDGKRCGASTDKNEAVELKWSPKIQESRKCQKQVPSLQELCLSILAKNADAITSLDFVPDVLRHKICWFLCDNRRMDSHFLQLLVHGSPTEIRVRDCSWLSEEQFTKIFEGCNASKLMVLQFDLCGSCMPDYTLYATLARSTNSLPALTMISLKGAYRLSDAGLSMLVSAAPSLRSINISQCPLLTSDGVCCLANSLRSVLRELYLDNCHGVDATSILPVLLKLENLEVLSLAGIQTVCDNFVCEFIAVHGCRMKELVLADCHELTDLSLEVIGDTCSELRTIDLSNLCKLTDVSIGHLANGCRAMQMLKFCRNAFSDEAIAAFLDVRGALLKDVSLNNIIQVSNHTALSLARNCRNLRSLDLSWCRNLTNGALGLVVDSCSSLEVLKLFGCTQITNVFVDGHSNPQLKLIGLKNTPVFKHIDVPDFLLGPLRYSSISP